MVFKQPKAKTYAPLPYILCWFYLRSNKSGISEAVKVCTVIQYFSYASSTSDSHLGTYPVPLLKLIGMCTLIKYRMHPGDWASVLPCCFLSLCSTKKVWFWRAKNHRVTLALISLLRAIHLREAWSITNLSWCPNKWYFRLSNAYLMARATLSMMS